MHCSFVNQAEIWYTAKYVGTEFNFKNQPIKKPIINALRISFIQWGINETITKLSKKFEENRISGQFYFFKQKKEHIYTVDSISYV